MAFYLIVFIYRNFPLQRQFDCGIVSTKGVYLNIYILNMQKLYDKMLGTAFM